MDPMVLRIFQREVERQARFGLMSALDLQDALRAGNADRVWHSVQSLLVAAGNVSKLLWPPDQAHDARGRELRESLGVPDDSDLAPHTFRNHFEHFDERLEAWATSSKRHDFVDSNIMPPGAIAGLEPGDFLRNLDPTSLTLTFRGDTYSLPPIVDALKTLWESAATEAGKPHWQA